MAQMDVNLTYYDDSHNKVLAYDMLFTRSSPSKEHSICWKCPEDKRKDCENSWGTLNVWMPVVNIFRHNVWQIVGSYL